jgi:hypothetical protein
VRIVLAIGAVVIVIAVVAAMRARRNASTRLTAGEEEIRGLVHEVYGQHITSEQVARQGNDAILKVDLRDESLKNLSINLTSLARKHAEGASLPALKTAMRF